MTETGCSQAGMNEAWYPENVHMFTQTIFGSIGFATGAAVGAAIAAKEVNPPYKRFILVTGDGSLQLTVQGFSMLQRYGVTPIMWEDNLWVWFFAWVWLTGSRTFSFVVNNKG